MRWWVRTSSRAVLMEHWGQRRMGRKTVEAGSTEDFYYKVEEVNGGRGKVRF